MAKIAAFAALAALLLCALALAEDDNNPFQISPPNAATYDQNKKVLTVTGDNATITYGDNCNNMDSRVVVKSTVQRISLGGGSFSASKPYTFLEFEGNALWHVTGGTSGAFGIIFDEEMATEDSTFAIKANDLTIEGGKMSLVNATLSADNLTIASGGLSTTGNSNHAGVECSGSISIKGGTNIIRKLSAPKLTISGGSLWGNISVNPVNQDNVPVYRTTLKIFNDGGLTAVVRCPVSELDATWESKKYSYGMEGVIADNSGQIYVWLPEGAEVTGAVVGGKAVAGSVVTKKDGSASGELCPSDYAVTGGGYAYENLSSANNQRGLLLKDGTPIIGMAKDVAEGLQPIEADESVSSITLDHVKIGGTDTTNATSWVNLKGNQVALTLEGENQIAPTWSHSSGNTLQAAGTLILQGPGSLAVTNTDSGGSAIKAENLTILGGKLSIAGNTIAPGIDVTEAISVKGGTIKIKNEPTCKSIQITGGSLWLGGGSISPALTNGKGANVYLTTLRLVDGSGNALGEDSPVSKLDVTSGEEAYGYGMTGVYTDDEGKIYVWLPEGAEVTGAVVDGKAVAGSVVTKKDGSASGELCPSDYAVTGGGYAYENLSSANNQRGLLLKDGTPIIGMAKDVAEGLQPIAAGENVSSITLDHVKIGGKATANNTSWVNLKGNQVALTLKGENQITLDWIKIGNLGFSFYSGHPLQAAGTLILQGSGSLVINGSNVGGAAIKAQNLKIRDGKLSATGASGMTGIEVAEAISVEGGTIRLFGKSSCKSIQITGGSLSTSYSITAPTNGQGANVYLTTLRLVDGSGNALGEHSPVSKLDVTSGEEAYGYGMTGVYTDDEGKIYVWLPEGAVVTGAVVDKKAFAGSVVTTKAGNATGDLRLCEYAVTGGSYAYETLDQEKNLFGLNLKGGAPTIRMADGVSEGSQPIAAEADVAKITLDHVKQAFSSEASAALYAKGDVTLTLQDASELRHVSGGGIQCDGTLTVQGDGRLKMKNTSSYKEGGNGASIRAKNLKLTGGRLNIDASSNGQGISVDETVFMQGGTVATAMESIADIKAKKLQITGGSLYIYDDNAVNGKDARVYRVSLYFPGAKGGKLANARVDSLNVAGIDYAYGMTGVYTDDAGGIYAWLPAGTRVTGARAGGRDYAFDLTVTTNIHSNYAEGVYVPPAPPVAPALAVTPGTAVLGVEKTLQLAANLPVTWSSADEGVATVDASGLVTGVAPGEAQIAAQSADGQRAYCALTVICTPDSLALSPDPAELAVGQTLQIEAALSPAQADGRLAWAVGDEGVATVDANGLLTGVAPGETWLSATAVNGLNARCAVRVSAIYPLPGSDEGAIALDEEYLLLSAGQKAQLSARAAGFVRWSAEGEEGVLKVDQAGLVTALKPGRAYAVATAESAGGEPVSARCRVDVIEKSASEEVTGAVLGEDSVTVKLYAEERASVRVSLTLPRNLAPKGAGRGAIASARFTEEKTAKRFLLSVLDDRTLEIQPVEGADISSNSYQSAVALTLSGGAEVVTEAKLTLKIDRSLPVVTGKLTFNTFYDVSEQILRLSGGEARSVTVLSCPDGMTFDPATMKAVLTGKIAKRAKLKLEAQMEGWSKPVAVSVPVTAKSTPPEIRLSRDELILDQESEVGIEAEVPIQDARVAPWRELSKQQKKNYKLNEEEKYGFSAEYREGKATIRASKPEDGKLLLAVRVEGGKEPVYAALNIQATADGLKLKQKGAVDVLRPESEVIVTPSMKCGARKVRLTAKDARKRDKGDWTDKFEIVERPDGSFSLRKAEGAELNPDYLYRFWLIAEVNGKEQTADLAFEVKKGKAAPKVSAKSVTLFANDRYSEATVTIGFDDETLAGIEKVTASSKRYEVKYLSDGDVRIAFKDQKASKKGETLKLKVYLKGYPKVAATVKVKVKLAQ